MSNKPRRRKIQQNNNKMKYELKAKTNGQAEYIRTILENVVIVASGCPGTGKTGIMVFLASKALLNGEIDKIIISRPIVEASPRSIGFLKGSLDEKIHPYLIPLEEEFKKFMGQDLYFKMKNEGRIKFEPLEFLRGRTFNDCYMCLDEAENADVEQLKMFVTRMGENTKVIINGDTEQTDMWTDGQFNCDFAYFIHKLKKANLEQFGFVELGEADIVRNPLIASFLRVFK